MRVLAKVTFWVAVSAVGLAGAVAARFYLLLPRRRAPVEVTAPRTTEAVARGRYLANSVAACMSCHSEIDETKPGDVVLGGRLGSGRDFGEMPGFPGRVRAPNLSSSEDGLAAWSDGEILRAMREGISRNGRPLFPFMPHPVYGRQLTDADALSLVSYLRTLPPVMGRPPRTEIDFPVSMFARSAPTPVAKGAEPLPQDPVARGRRLIELASCAECHNAFDNHHQPLPGMYLAGGYPFAVAGKGTVYAPNLTPDPDTGIGRISDEQVLRALKAGVGKDGRVLWIMPWTAYTGLTDEDARAIVAALRTVPPVGNPVPARTFRD